MSSLTARPTASALVYPNKTSAPLLQYNTSPSRLVAITASGDSSRSNLPKSVFVPSPGSRPMLCLVALGKLFHVCAYRLSGTAHRPALWRMSPVKALRPLLFAPRLACSSRGAQERRHVVERQRFAEEVSLQLVASEPIQFLGLLLSIDALRDDFEPQRMSHRDDGRDERHDGRVFQHGDDERAVDLERVYRELRQVTERGIAGAEVIDRDAHSERPNRFQLLHVRLDVFHDEGLRDL